MEKEEKKLDGVYLGRLTHPEFSQCIDRQVTEIKAQGTAVLIDATMNELLGELETEASVFHTAILQFQKNPYTDLIARLDFVRDRALRIYEIALNEFKYSQDQEELNAYHKLMILNTNYKGIAKLNYEAETKELKKYLGDLASDQFKSEVALLKLGSYVDKIVESSTNFNEHYNSRSNEISAKAAYDAIVIRKSLQKRYNHFAGYILALANGLDKEPYNSTLKIMNTTRSHFDDIILRREGIKNANQAQENSVNMKPA